MTDLHVYWWSPRRKDGRENYGDLMGLYIARKLSRKNIMQVASIEQANAENIPHYLTIGSIISLAMPGSTVWGSGIIRRDEAVRPATFVAVRGPKTRARLQQLGYTVPELYGDPALLMPKFFPDVTEKKYELGIIPHYVDYHAVKEAFANDPRVKVINLLTKNIERTTRDILECKRTISSSLHGVIVSHAYMIPSIWTVLSDKLAGDNIKFHDYFESVGITYAREIFTAPENYNYDFFMRLLEEHKDASLPDKALLALRCRQLLKSCPFKRKWHQKLFGFIRRQVRKARDYLVRG